MEILKLPTSLRQITLEQWVQWDEVYGKKLAKKAMSIPVEHEDELMLFNYELNLKYYCHYTNTSLEELNYFLDGKPEFKIEVIKVVCESQMMIFREMCELKENSIPEQFSFNDSKWSIVPPVKVQKPEYLTIKEFDLSQAIALIFSELQGGNSQALYELCAAYLRPNGFPFAGTKKQEIELMKSLPLHIALCVKRYVEETFVVYSMIGRDVNATTS